MRRYTSALMVAMLAAGTSVAQQPINDFAMQMVPAVVFDATNMPIATGAMS